VLTARPRGRVGEFSPFRRGMWRAFSCSGRDVLPMQLPFTTEQFFDLLAAYNEALWPALAVLWMASLIASLLLFSSRRPSNRWLSGLLAAHWIWSALAYHAAFFTRINPAAWGLRRALPPAGRVVFLAGGRARKTVVRSLAQRVGASGVGPDRVLAAVPRHQCRATFQCLENPSVRRPMPDDDLHGRRPDARHPTIVASVDHSCDVVRHRRVRGEPAWRTRRLRSADCGYCTSGLLVAETERGENGAWRR
jgi:hypothetical protein